MSGYLDNVATNGLFSKPAIAKLDKQIAEQEQIVDDKSKSKAERTVAAKKIEVLQNQKREVKELTIDHTKKAGYQGVRSAIASRKDIADMDYFTEDIIDINNIIS